ncbi:MAG: hypothetical protein JSS83_11920 [Cyanobacteria bacterium SZAS LIN-3]|nr:hypothetical protein [Cyanobacteria bacterium SZAS LIN-3]
MTSNKLQIALPPPLNSQFLRRLPWRPAPLLVLFSVILFFTIISSFSKRVLGMAIVFDSAMYLHSSVCVLTYLKALLSFQTPSPETFKLLAEGVLLDGPVLPILGGLFYLLLGLTPSIKDMGAALFLQAILHALSAVLVYHVLFDLTRKKTTSLLGGYAWGFYPAAILGAGKFMTEILTTCLLLSLVLAVARMVKPKFALATGLLLGLIALTKAALAPASALVIAFGLIYLIITKCPRQKILASAIATACGAGLMLGPWMLFTYKITGKAQITTNRQPTHNMVSGVNPENDGWASLPDTPLGLMFSDNDPALPSAMSIVLSHPGYELQLMARKIVRLFSQPWNDYRLSCLLVPIPMQIAWHKLLMALGLFGLLALFMDIARKQIDRVTEIHDTKIELLFCTLVILVLGHFIYLPFVACSRYGFTAMPLMTVFATIGLARIFGLGGKALLAVLALSYSLFAFEFNPVKVLEQQVLNNHNIDVLVWATVFKGLLCLSGMLMLIRLLRRSNGFKFLPWQINAFLAMMLTVILGTVAIDTYCEPLNGELVFKFSHERPMHRTCVLSEEELKNPALKAAYLVLDSRTKTTILGQMNVNDNLQTLFLAPFFLLHPEPNLEGCYEMFARLRFQKAAELNQWYLAEIPVSSLKAGKNQITITPEQKYILSVNGSPKSRYLQGNYVNLPSLNYFSPTLLMNDLDGYDARPRQTYYIATGKGRRIDCSLERNLDGDYDRTNLNCLLLLVYERPAESAGQATPATGPAINMIGGIKQMDLHRCLVVPH